MNQIKMANSSSGKKKGSPPKTENKQRGSPTSQCHEGNDELANINRCVDLQNARKNSDSSISNIDENMSHTPLQNQVQALQENMEMMSTMVMNFILE